MEETRIFVLDKEVRTPSENLAINRLCVDLVEHGKYDLLSRIYKHKKGVILGSNESAFDINPDFCLSNGYEIIRRSSGGSAIVVDPELTLCYSIFLKNDFFGSTLDFNKMYKAVTFSLAKHLGGQFSVEGVYYLRYKTTNGNIPIAGHAIRSYRKVMQFDGVINKKPFDMNILERILKLRELYEFDGRKFISIDGIFYDINGNKVEVDASRAVLLRRERDELEKIIGLENIGLTETDFVKSFHSMLSDVFGSVKLVKEIPIEGKDLKVYYDEVIRKDYTDGRKCLGHCFVDLVEEEPLTLYSVQS
ncbi:MAG: hypothetical protein QW404_00950 [Candidatus Nanoarchaeia archaeon]